MIPFNTPYQQWRWQRQQKQHRLTQGRLTTAEAAAQLSGDGAIPLASVPDSKKDSLISIPAEVEGHLLLVAPPDSQWRAHLISILVHWPSAALVVDPDGSFYQKTGQFRDTLWGKVYSIPGYRFNLNEYYRCWNGDAAAKLHRFLMWPVPAAETWPLDHSVALIHALGLYSFHHKRNPMQDLLDAAATNLLQVLEALATVPDAWHHGCRFTKGLSPRDALLDADVVHSFALFSQQMQRYQKTYASFTIESVSDVLPKAWTQVKHTLYLTYTMAEMSEMVGLVAALVDGIRRYHHTFGRYRKLL
ncbi:MAG: hypothetical protein GY952_01790, partial [Rhodobacteraceae bacterium]|nr:hypothetical protein [Paracoccaceae bacterium]